ncbi:unnamed protein product [Penicillium nalgiovense]|nr:unnamed protein product [Penicillium nalgiovense]
MGAIQSGPATSPGICKNTGGDGARDWAWATLVYTFCLDRFTMGWRVYFCNFAEDLVPIIIIGYFVC